MTNAAPPSPDPVHIRRARAEDLASIEALEHASFTRGEERFHRKQIAGLLANARGVALVAERGGHILGWAIGLIRQDPRTHGPGGRVYGLAVGPEARGLGVGGTLFTRLLAELGKRGVQRVWLEVRDDNEPAIKLYLRHGFVKDRHLKDYYGEGVHGLRMLRDHAPPRAVSPRSPSAMTSGRAGPTRESKPRKGTVVKRNAPAAKPRRLPGFEHSHGHARTKRHHRIPTNDTLMSGEMLEQAVEAILKRVRLDRAHDIPYLAGYSQNGKTIYIDRHIPRSLVSRGRRHDIIRFLVLHEAVEKTLLMQLGLHYQHAHQIALRAEQAAVRAHGIPWRDYDRFMQRYIKDVGDNELEKLPADLDIKPYRDEHDSETLKRMRAAMPRKQPRNRNARKPRKA